jgi:hypothetical protein
MSDELAFSFSSPFSSVASGRFSSLRLANSMSFLGVQRLRFWKAWRTIPPRRTWSRRDAVLQADVNPDLRDSTPIPFIGLSRWLRQHCRRVGSRLASASAGNFQRHRGTFQPDYRSVRHPLNYTDTYIRRASGRPAPDRPHPQPRRSRSTRTVLAPSREKLNSP